eukprot:gene10136-15583_t
MPRAMRGGLQMCRRWQSSASAKTSWKTDQSAVSAGRPLVAWGFSKTFQPFSFGFGQPTKVLNFSPIIADGNSKYRFRCTLLTDRSTENMHPYYMELGPSLTFTWVSEQPIIFRFLTPESKQRVRLGHESGLIVVGLGNVVLANGTILRWLRLGFCVGKREFGSGILAPSGARKERQGYFFAATSLLELVKRVVLIPISVLCLIVLIVAMLGYRQLFENVPSDSPQAEDMNKLIKAARDEMAMGNTESSRRLMLLVQELQAISSGKAEAAAAIRAMQKDVDVDSD